ncbi:MAG: hypothetical protein FWE45_00735 [Firmicutes bacterium]|nr:hypothetical protein [Bacillota bacterium]
MGRDFLNFLRLLSFVLFIASVAGLVFLIVVLTANDPNYSAYDMSITIPLAVFIPSLLTAIFLTIWIPIRHKQIYALLENLRKNGHRTTAEFSGNLIRGGGSHSGHHAVSSGREYKSPFFVKYTDEKGKHHNRITQQTFTLNEKRRYQRAGEFKIACRGKWFVILED